MNYKFLPATALIFIIIISCSKDDENNSDLASNTLSIEDQVFEIYENSPNGSTVGIVNVNNTLSSNIRFLIESGNDLGAFQINQTSGEISVIQSDFIDFESNPEFSLIVNVSNGELSKSAKININLIDIEGVFLDSPVEGLHIHQVEYQVKLIV